ncbi:MAG: hypothetical protein WD801_01710 [Gemmatimonadaceae bacterium]
MQGPRRLLGDWPDYDYIVGSDFAGADTTPKVYFRLHVDIRLADETEAENYRQMLARGDHQGCFDRLVAKTMVRAGERGHAFLKAAFGVGYEASGGSPPRSGA